MHGWGLKYSKREHDSDTDEEQDYGDASDRKAGELLRPKSHQKWIHILISGSRGSRRIQRHARAKFEQ